MFVLYRAGFGAINEYRKYVVRYLLKIVSFSAISRTDYIYIYIYL